MSQISPPIRIVLVCAVAFMAAWMLFLRPKDDAGVPAASQPVPTAPTPVEAGGAEADGLAGQVVEQANEATAAQDKRAEELAGGAGETAADPATAATAPATSTKAVATGAPADFVMPSKADLARVPKPVRKSILARKVVILGVYSPKGVDDQLMRKQLKRVDTLHGRVAIHRVDVRNVSRYGAITRGVDLERTPTTVVIGFDLKATPIAGWVDAKSIDQAVVDSIRNSGGSLFTSTYLRRMDQICTAVPLSLQSPSTTPKEYTAAVADAEAYLSGAQAKVAALTPPRELRGFDRKVRADLGAAAAVMGSYGAALGSKPTAAKIVATYPAYNTRYEVVADRIERRMDSQDVLGCGSRG